MKLSKENNYVDLKFEPFARNPCDIAATNRTKNRTWFTQAILKLQL